ncbi:hypothetical protein [Pseudalkalibacillus caeni]|uniref:Uncharacterized protein n=1 Tax=Exobacillus caeni TaxID=2574798 RepID=A0A5R9FDP9_9BACL|nr:hypothetical protein [Pseudalkalibacillus caeni]TLS39003.1 hypothetical protein FCL54_01450 [Pseudalkalibacillus caeni]
MSRQYYNLCCENRGKPVEIECFDGKVHRGVIHEVDNEFVYLSPLDGPPREGPTGPGTFLWGFGGAFAGGFLGGLFGVSLASIAFFRPYGFFY